MFLCKKNRKKLFIKEIFVLYCPQIASKEVEAKSIIGGRNMRYLFSATFAALIGLALAQPAHAVSPIEKDYYLSFGVGPIIATNDYAFGNNTEVIDLAGASAAFQIEVAPDVGLHIEGAVGAWIGPVYRTEIGVGWRAYDADGTLSPANSADVQTALAVATGRLDLGTSTSIVSEVTAINISWNSYFHPLEGHHQPYAGFGLGIGFWSVDSPILSDSFDIAFLGHLTAGYDFYLSGLPSGYKDMMGGSFVDDIAVGVSYRFSWSEPRPRGLGGDPTITANDELQQISHAIMFSARYEF